MSPLSNSPAPVDQGRAVEIPTVVPWTAGTKQSGEGTMVKVRICGKLCFLSWMEYERLVLWNAKIFPAVDIVFIQGFIVR